MGAFFLTRRRLFEQVHGFDPRFFMYYEEVDYSLRLYQLGFKTAFLAGVHALHVGGSSSRTIPARRLYYSLQSRILYARKHFMKSGCLVVLVATLLIEFPTRLVWAGLTLAPRSAGATVIAYTLLWRDLVLHGLHDGTR
jgi:GT2 family glycosyltransferase